MQIPGTYRDAMSGNTQLGKAVRDACEELDTLAALEMETLNEAEQLLKKVGFKGSLFNKEPWHWEQCSLLLHAYQLVLRSASAVEKVGLR